jgi:hypothetical protein
LKPAAINVECSEKAPQLKQAVAQQFEGKQQQQFEVKQQERW